jgi:hypothetical protein
MTSRIAAFGWFAFAAPALLILVLSAPTCAESSATAPASRPAEAPFQIEKLLFSDDFDGDLSNWSTELERGGSVTIRDGGLDIDVPAGCTVWFKPRLNGPVMIEYQATVISAGGANDRVSDLNCFWMARDSRSPDDIFATKRGGRFPDYDRLLTYYVGQGGNGNTTTRFRRYTGESGNRPLRAEDDLRDKRFMLTANVAQTIRLIAGGSTVQYYRNDERFFDFTDPKPYASGWFAFRTTKNHMSVRRFRVDQLAVPKSPH